MNTILLLMASALSQSLVGITGDVHHAGGGGSIAFVNAASGCNAGALCDSSTHQCAPTSAIAATTGNLIYVITGYDVAGGTCLAPVSVTDNASNTYTAIGALNGANGSFACTQGFYAKNITGNAALVVTATYHLTATQVSVVALQASGLDTSTPLDAGPANNAAQTSSPVASASYSTGTANEILVAGISNYYTSSAITAGTGYTMPAAGKCDTGLNGLNTLAVEYKIVSATQSSITSGGTFGGSVYSNVSVGTFK